MKTGKGGKMFQILIGDRSYRRRLYQLLRREGYSVLQASGGEDVLKVLETSYIDFIILGDNLTDLNAYDLMGQLRDTYSEMPLMVLTERKDRESLRKSYMAGVDEYLPKNVDDEELLLRIRAVLRRAEIMTRSCGLEKLFWIVILYQLQEKVTDRHCPERNSGFCISCFLILTRYLPEHS